MMSTHPSSRGSGAEAVRNLGVGGVFGAFSNLLLSFVICLLRRASRAFVQVVAHSDQTKSEWQQKQSKEEEEEKDEEEEEGGGEEEDDEEEEIETFCLLDT